MLHMIRQARLALGVDPAVRADLYDVRRNYLYRGDMFLLAVSDDDQALGCVGYHRIEDGHEAFLHRFYVRADRKRQGIGTALLISIEEIMRKSGISISRVHLGGSSDVWHESYAFYPKHGYTLYAPRYMMKIL